MKLLELESFYRVQSKFYDATRWAFLFDRKKAVRYLDIRPGNSVIDFACGTGLNMQYILRARPAKVIGIDYSPSMLRVARKKYPGIEFIEGDIATYSFSEKVDRIIISYGISIVDEWEQAVANMYDSLKPQGTLVVHDFYPWNAGVMRKLFYPLHRWWLKRHGVDPEKDIAEVLRSFFTDVRVHLLNGGYDVIMVAKGSKEIAQ